MTNATSLALLLEHPTVVAPGSKGHVALAHQRGGQALNHLSEEGRAHHLVLTDRRGVDVSNAGR